MATGSTTWTDLLPRETSGPVATMALGAEIAVLLQPGDLVALYGDLGAGKTHLTKGLCTALGVPEDHVSSPTFTLVNVYDGDAFPIYHIDAYRIKSVDEFFELGYAEYFFGDGICLIEWPTRVEPLLPEHTLRLHLTHGGGDLRRIVRMEMAP